MGGVRHTKRLDAHPFGLHAVERRRDSGPFPRNNEMVRPVMGGDAQGPVAAGNHRVDIIFRSKNRGHRPIFGMRFGQAPPLRHDAERIAERQQPGDTGGGVFTEAVAQHRHGFDSPRPPQRRKCVFDREERRLCVSRAID